VGRATWGQAGADGGGAALHDAGDAAVGGPRAEIARLQRENERLRMERDILKKSIAIFAGVPK
jgi:transposase-like protein